MDDDDKEWNAAIAQLVSLRFQLLNNAELSVDERAQLHLNVYLLLLKLTKLNRGENA